MISSADLRYFVALAQIKHMSRAAEKLGITQPALSHCISRVEVELNTTLFLRSKKGVELTPAGKRLYTQSRLLQQQWQRVVNSVHDEVDAPQGHIQLGIHSAVAQYALPLFLPEFLKQNPRINVQLHHDLSRHLTSDVIAGKIDVAIVVNPVAHPDLVIRDLCKDEVTIWRPKHCQNSNLLLIEPHLLQTQDILSKLGKKKIVFSQVVESSSLELIAQLLSAGTGYAVLPKRIVQEFCGNHVETVKGAPVFHDRICVVFKTEFKSLRRGQVFLEALKEAFSL